MKLAAALPAPTLTFTPDPVFDLLAGTAARWERTGADPAELGALTEHITRDGLVDPRTADGHGALEVICLFARLAGQAADTDPKTLLVTSPYGTGVDAVAASIGTWLTGLLSELPVPLVHRAPADHISPVRERLRLLDVELPVATPETQALVWSALRGVAAVAATTIECGQRWAGPAVDELERRAAELAAATTAAFAPPWHQVACAAQLRPDGSLHRLDGATIGLAYLLDNSMTSANRWVTEHCVEAVAGLVDQAGNVVSGTPDRRCWTGEVHMAARALQAAGRVELAGMVDERLAAHDVAGPAAFWDAADPSRRSQHTSVWAYEAARSAGL